MVDARGAVFCRGADNFQSLCFKFALQSIQLGNLFAAWNAPRGPEVKQDDAPFNVVEMKRRARKGLKLHVGCGCKRCVGRRWRRRRSRSEIQFAFPVWQPGRNSRTSEQR